MSLRDVLYQGPAQRMIQRALASARMPHAYIFHGPDGVGKEAFARGLAEALLCRNPIDHSIEAPEAERVGADAVRTGCGACEDCRAVAAESHPDLHLIHRRMNKQHPDAAVRARKSLELGVDVLRHFVIDKVRLTPQRGRSKVFILREADRITIQAQNALLKTLEEPPIDTVIILCTEVVDRLLPTTRSRCQLVRFDTLPARFIRDRISEMLPELAANQADWCAQSAGGSLGRALQYATDGLFEVYGNVAGALGALAVEGPAGIAEVWTTTAKSLARHESERDREISDTESNRRGLKQLLQLTAKFYDDALHDLSGSGVGHAAASGPEGSQSPPTGTSVGACQAIGRLAEAERQLDLNANTQLVIETLANDLAGIAAAAAPTG